MMNVHKFSIHVFMQKNLDPIKQTCFVVSVARNRSIVKAYIRVRSGILGAFANRPQGPYRRHRSGRTGALAHTSSTENAGGTRAATSTYT